MSGRTARSAPTQRRIAARSRLSSIPPAASGARTRPAADQLLAHGGVRAEHGDLDRRVEVREQVGEHALGAGEDRGAREAASRTPHAGAPRTRRPASRAMRPIQPPSMWPIWASSHAGVVGGEDAQQERQGRRRRARRRAMARMTPGNPVTPWRIAHAASPAPAAASSGRTRAARSHEPASTARLAIRSITHRRQDLGREVRQRRADGVVARHQHEREREVEHRREAAREHGRAGVVEAGQQRAADRPDRERRQAEHEDHEHRAGVLEVAAVDDAAPPPGRSRRRAR